MSISDDFDPLAYVEATAPLIGLSLTQERVAELAAAFALVLRVATPALDFELPADAEAAPIFTP